MDFTRMGLTDFARTWKTIHGATEPLFAGTDTYANNCTASSLLSLANVESSSKPAASTPRGKSATMAPSPRSSWPPSRLLDQAYTKQEDRRLLSLNVRHLGPSACPRQRPASRRRLDCNESCVATDARLLAPLQDRLVIVPQLLPRQVRIFSPTHKVDQVLFHVHGAIQPSRFPTGRTDSRSSNVRSPTESSKCTFL